LAGGAEEEAAMSEVKTWMEGPRVRGKAYQLEDGLWTYFILLGEGENERTIHCPQKYGWSTKEGAIAAMKSHIVTALRDVSPEIQITDRKTGRPLEGS